MSGEVLQVQDVQTGAIYVLRPGEPLLVGRQDPSCAPDVACNDPHVSRRHCELTLVTGGRVRVRDTSSYGTYINEQRVTGDGWAKSGDRLRLGHQYALALLIPQVSELPTALELPSADRETVTSLPTPVRGMPQTLGKYRLIRELGEGGMGVVYKAHDPERDAPCAIKVLREAAEAEGAERFKREARLAATLGDYPAIVKVYDWGAIGPRALFLVMDYVDGVSLTQLIRTGLDVLVGARLVGRTARAVAYAHERGVVHRDLKPDNVLVTREYQVRLTDFGIAKEDGSGLTMTGMAMGTPNYMAPEQIADSKRAGPPADVYGLGAILYTVMTRQPPYVGKSLGTVLRKVQAGDLTRPRQVDPGLDPELEAICLRALARVPDERWPSAAELGRALDEWVKSRMGGTGRVQLDRPQTS
ncbi:MAG: protein kinase [Planctomycetota bacterium]